MLIWCSRRMLLLTMLKTAVLLNIFVETVIHISQDSLMNSKTSIHLNFFDI